LRPIAWAALAKARLQLSDPRGAAGALKASILLGPYERPLALYRGRLGVSLWRVLDDEERDFVALELRLAWETDRPGLRALARNGGAVPVMLAYAAVLTEVLAADDPAAEGDDLPFVWRREGRTRAPAKADKRPGARGRKKKP